MSDAQVAADELIDALGLDARDVPDWVRRYLEWGEGASASPERLAEAAAFARFGGRLHDAVAQPLEMASAVGGELALAKAYIVFMAARDRSISEALALGQSTP